MPVARKKALMLLPVEGLIRIIRGQKVMLDSDLAGLYGVTTGALNQAVRRNSSRFPEDFMFRLSSEEAKSLISQFVISKMGRGGSRHLPYAFTEHGVVMLSSVLNSERAAQMNILVVRAFVRMRNMIAAYKDLASRIEKLEQSHEKTGSVIEILIEDIDRLARDIHWIKNPPLPQKHPIGFHIGKGASK